MSWHSESKQFLDGHNEPKSASLTQPFRLFRCCRKHRFRSLGNCGAGNGEMEKHWTSQANNKNRPPQNQRVSLMAGSGRPMGNGPNTKVCFLAEGKLNGKVSFFFLACVCVSLCVGCACYDVTDKSRVESRTKIKKTPKTTAASFTCRREGPVPKWPQMSTRTRTPTWSASQQTMASGCGTFDYFRNIASVAGNCDWPTADGAMWVDPLTTGRMNRFARAVWHSISGVMTDLFHCKWRLGRRSFSYLSLSECRPFWRCKSIRLSPGALRAHHGVDEERLCQRGNSTSRWLLRDFCHSLPSFSFLSFAPTPKRRRLAVDLRSLLGGQLSKMPSPAEETNSISKICRLPSESA